MGELGISGRVFLQASSPGFLWRELENKQRKYICDSIYLETRAALIYIRSEAFASTECNEFFMGDQPYQSGVTSNIPEIVFDSVIRRHLPLMSKIETVSEMLHTKFIFT
jgi:hypothetical protein